MVRKIDDIELMITESEKSIQINEVPENKMAKIWAHLVDEYVGYEVFFCFNSERATGNLEIPIDFLDEMGAERLDDTVIFRLREERFLPSLIGKIGIFPLDETTFSEFASFHDRRHPDFFWTSQRLWERLELWQIHLLYEEKVLIGYVMTLMEQRHVPKMAEIFQVEAADGFRFQSLLETTCEIAFDKGKTEVLYMVEKSDMEMRQEVLRNIGFREVGFYQGFRIEVCQSSNHAI